jgi:CobQ-like glutamine amidotransferase family enzyme
VRTGTGNGSPDAAGVAGEGALTERFIGTYMHGPALARNPSLADYILHRATGLALGPIELPDQAAVRQQYLSA